MKKSEKKVERVKPRSYVYPGKFRVSIIGAGRLGTTLGRAFQAIGYPIDLVVAKHQTSAQRAARLIKSKASTIIQLRRSQSARDRLFGTNFLLISTPDDALELVASQLSVIFQTQIPGISARKKNTRIAMHTSGALTSEVLKPLRSAGFAVASIHPLISIADSKSNQQVFQGAYFCIEGDREAVRVARSIVRALNGNSFTIDANSKALYHAAAVMSSGHVVALFDLAVETLKRCGLAERRAREVLLPLLNSSIANLVSKDSARALTGPFSRGDSKTAAKHLAALRSAGADAAMAAYVVLGRRSLDLARTVQRDSKTFREISRLLSRARKQT